MSQVGAPAAGIIDVLYCGIRWARSGAGVSSSILVPIVVGVLTVLTVVRFVSLVLVLNDCPENPHHELREAPMKRVMVWFSSLVETTWALGVSVGAGLLLVS